MTFPETALALGELQLDVGALDFARALLDGLGKVHSAGFLHRDIKPDNIFMRADGSPVLIDFGSARAAMGKNVKTMTTLVTPAILARSGRPDGQPPIPARAVSAPGHRGPDRRPGRAAQRLTPSGGRSSMDLAHAVRKTLVRCARTRRRSRRDRGRRDRRVAPW